MAIYRLNFGFVSRSTGRSAVQSAAYITGSSLHESRCHLQANYTKSHRDIAFTATLTPEQAPSFYRELSKRTGKGGGKITYFTILCRRLPSSLPLPIDKESQDRFP